MSGDWRTRNWDAFGNAARGQALRRRSSKMSRTASASATGPSARRWLLARDRVCRVVKDSHVALGLGRICA